MGAADGVALCVGAGLQRFVPGLWLDLVDGTTLTLEPGSAAVAAPSLAAVPYLVSHGPGRCAIGATWFRPAAPGQRTGAAPTTEAELLAAARAIWPPLGGWNVAGAARGTRAVSKRTHQGAVPYCGRVDRPAPNTWVLGGLGSRGLLYHAWLGRLVAQGLLEGSDSHLPAPLVRWKSWL